MLAAANRYAIREPLPHEPAAASTLMFSSDRRIPRKLILLNRLFSARLSKRERSTSDVTHPVSSGSRSSQQQSSAPHQSHPRGT